MFPKTRGCRVISIFNLAAGLLTLGALAGWFNRRVLGLPHAIGFLAMGLIAAASLTLADTALPGQRIGTRITDVLRQVDFTDVVMNGMLAFLLFAGSLNLDLSQLRDRAWPVAVLALVSTVVSTAIVGTAFWEAARLTGVGLSLQWALVFGALISPTDPVAVLATLKTVAVPDTIRIEMEGEALFNDGVGVVIFSVLLAIATRGEAATSLSEATIEFLREAGGGTAIGLLCGYIAYRAMRSIDDYPVEVLITLGLVAGTYALAQALGTSGPLAVVAAGLLIGDLAPRDAMSDRTQGYVTALWHLVDEVLNALLFLMIGLEVALLHFPLRALLLALAAIPLVLVARLIAVGLPIATLPFGKTLSVRTIPFFTWAGVRGGISVALALALPDGEAKPTILAATYAVVLFTIIVQGSTLGALARRTFPDAAG